MRLTNHMRQRIKGHVVRSTFDPRYKEERLNAEKLADKLYARIFKKDQLELLAKIPEGWMRTTSELGVNVGGQHHMLWLAEHRRIPFELRYTRVANLDANDELGEEIVAWSNRWMDLRQREQGLNDKIHASLGVINTIKQLREAWPEVFDLVPAEILGETAKPQLPAVQFKDLTAEIQQIREAA